MKRTLLAGTIAIFGLALAAAAPAPTPEREALSADDQLLALGREIPGFGGMFVDGDGAVHLYLVDRAHGGGRSDEAWLAKAFGAPVRVHPADFTFERLVSWKRALAPVLALSGVTSLDADERRNRLAIGVSRGLARNDRERLDAAVAAAGVPAAAVVVEEGAPFATLAAATPAAKARPSATLQDTMRPIPGGVQVSWFCESGPCRPCTDGFTAFRGHTLGFVTASHCSHQRGAVEGTRYFQSSPASGAAIGSEIADAPFVPCNGRRCRGSDASFVRFDRTSLGSLARIARPISRDSNLGSLVVTPASARLKVTGSGSTPLAGDTLHKIGRTTGWTYGPVVASCMDVNLDDSDITYVCQTAVAAGVGVGDSGSPVFTRSGGGNNALLQGIVWGAGEVNRQDVFIFSPLAAIQRELGPLRLR